MIDNDIISLPFFSTVITDAAQACLEIIRPNKKKPYLSRETWRKIRTRNDMRANNATNKDIKQLSKEIAKDAKVDKQRDLIERFKENPEDKPKKQMWKAVKELRNKMVPQFVKMKNQTGAHVTLVQLAETIAEYLAHEHWKNTSDADVSNTRKFLEGNDAATGSFSINELNEAIKATQSNKQPGPDGIIMELFEWLDKDNWLHLLSLINTWWKDRKAPQELFFARVVPIYIYKKGDADVAANYRPISLLNSAYKIYMMMIRSRMQTAISHQIAKTQYGCRTAMPTAHVIYVVRRVQDYAESTSSSLSLALLDWEMAFDKVQHDKLILSLNRFGFDVQYLDVTRDCYRKPEFYVKDDYGTSETKVQSSGIRQGCPLSPFLFVLVMTCLDTDIREAISQSPCG